MLATPGSNCWTLHPWTGYRRVVRTSRILFSFFSRHFLRLVIDLIQSAWTEIWQWLRRGTEPSSGLVFKMEMFAFARQISKKRHIQLPRYMGNGPVGIQHNHCFWSGHNGEPSVCLLGFDFEFMHVKLCDRFVLHLSNDHLQSSIQFT